MRLNSDIKTEEITVNRIKSITLGDFRELSTTGVRSLFVVNEDGEELEITFFGDEESLKIKTKVESTI